MANGRPARNKPEPRPPAGGLPPHDIAAERALLSGIMIWCDPIYEATRETVSAVDFFRDDHAGVWRAIEVVARRREPIATATVAYELYTSGSLGTPSETWSALESLAGNPFDPIVMSNDPAYYQACALVVWRCAERRRLIARAGELAQEAYAGDIGRAQAGLRSQRHDGWLMRPGGKG